MQKAEKSCNQLNFTEQMESVSEKNRMWKN